MPAPGFQKPIPYLLETDDKKLKTSLEFLIAKAKSSLAPDFAWIKWSQWTVVGTATFSFNLKSNVNTEKTQISIPLPEILDNTPPIIPVIKRINDLELELKNIQDTSPDSYNNNDNYMNTIASHEQRLIELEGKVYLAKDSTLNSNEFKEMF